MELFGYDAEKSFKYEEGFYLTSNIDRMGKMLAHFQLYEMIKELPGNVVELGVFRGASFVRWLTFRNLLENENSRKVIGFDAFDYFPETNYESDKKYREHFINTAGSHSINENDLTTFLEMKRLVNFELVKGNILETLPEYFTENTHMKISLLHIDTDVYEPCKLALELLWDRVVKGGIIIFDDYGTFPGETNAVDEFFKEKNIAIKKLPISHGIPAYVIKDNF